jgi:hypothetical protein
VSACLSELDKYRPQPIFAARNCRRLSGIKRSGPAHEISAPPGSCSCQDSFIMPIPSLPRLHRRSRDWPVISPIPLEIQSTTSIRGACDHLCIAEPDRPSLCRTETPRRRLCRADSGGACGPATAAPWSQTILGTAFNHQIHPSNMQRLADRAPSKVVWSAPPQSSTSACLLVTYSPTAGVSYSVYRMLSRASLFIITLIFCWFRCIVVSIQFSFKCVKLVI